jgi:hypothetical protein
MKPLLTSTLPAGAAAIVLAMVCFGSLRAADEKLAPTPEDARLKRINDHVRRLNGVLNELEAKKAITPEQRAEMEKKYGLAPTSVKPVPTSPGSKDPFGKHGFKLVPPAVKTDSTNASNLPSPASAEANSFNYKSVRTSVYEGERRSAEKIEQHVRAADAKAKALLERGPPSPVLGR